MRKRNAFTLIELLAVIVILAVLALITIPIISNVINDVRLKSLKEGANGLIETSNLYYAQYGNTNNIRFDINNNKIESKNTSNLLSYKGNIKEGTIIIDKKGKVTICITDGKNAAYKNYNESKVTTKKGQRCYIEENSYIVYLSDDGATLTEYDNAKLTELINSMQEKINNLENNNNQLNQQIANLNSQLITTKNEVVSLIPDIVTYETDWFDIAPSGIYSFELSKDFENISKEDLYINLVGKVKTDQNGFTIGQIVYPQFNNYNGDTGYDDIGATVWIDNNLMGVRFGNNQYFVLSSPSGTIKTLNKTNVQVKIIVRALK